MLAVFVATVAFSHREPTAEEGRYDAINGLEIIATIFYFTLFASFLPFATWHAMGLVRLLLFALCILLLRRPPVLLAVCPAIKELCPFTPASPPSHSPTSTHAHFQRHSRQAHYLQVSGVDGAGGWVDKWTDERMVD